MKKTSEKKEEKKFEWTSFLKEYVPYVVLIILVLLFKRYCYSPVQVRGDSMDHTLQDGDIMILDIMKYRFHEIQRFDIVVVKAEKEWIIKRVIGLPGETVEYKDNTLYINGKEKKDVYGNGDTENFKVKVPNGSYYVLGDNRKISLDSRYFGPFKKKDIIGKTNLTIFPFSRIGKKE